MLHWAMSRALLQHVRTMAIKMACNCNGGKFT
jgi:hypothetical protein